MTRTPTTAAAAPPGVAGRGSDSRPRQRLMLLVLLAAGFMDILDANIVTVAIPAIQRDLGASYTQAQWVVVGHLLPFALGLITGGRLGDLYGRKRVFLAGMAGFAAASLAGGLATGPGMLITARVAQGAMAAAMVPQILAIIQVTVPPERRGAAYALYGALGSLAHVSALLIGGILIDADLLGLGWRPVFLINLPVCALALALAAVVLPESRAPRTHRLDLAGVALVGLGLLAVLYPLLQGHALGWPAWTVAAPAAAVGLLVAFAAWERHTLRRGGAPLVAPSLFGRRSFVAGLLVVLTFFGAVAGLLLTLTLYLQQGLGYSALRSGLTSIPFPVGVALAAGAATRLAPRSGRWPTGRGIVTTGALAAAAGAAGLQLTLYLTATVHPWHLSPALLLGGLGMGLVVGPVISVAQHGVPTGDAGAVSGVLNTCIQLGSAAGVAVLGLVFVAALGNAPTAAGAARVAGFTTALHHTLWAALGAFTAVGLLSLLLPRGQR